MNDETDRSDEDNDRDEVVSMYEKDETSTTETSQSGDASAENSESGDTTTETAESESSQEPELKAPSVEPAGGELESVTGTFYVKYAQDKSVTLHEVETAQICTLIENPGFERHEIIEGTLEAQPPMGVSYLVEGLDSQYRIPIEESSESLTTHVRDIGTEELDVGDAIAIEREGKGEIHIIRVDPAQTRQTVEELLDDEMTYKNAARFEHVERVEIRSDGRNGVVSIRYLP